MARRYRVPQRRGLAHDHCSPSRGCTRYERGLATLRHEGWDPALAHTRCAHRMACAGCTPLCDGARANVHSSRFAVHARNVARSGRSIILGGTASTLLDSVTLGSSDGEDRHAAFTDREPGPIRNYDVDRTLSTKREMR